MTILNKQGGQRIERLSASDPNDTLKGSIAMTASTLPQSVSKKQEAKKCTKCFIIKPLSEFYIRKDRKSGYWPHCKICHCYESNKYKTSAKQKIAYAKWYSLNLNKIKVKEAGNRWEQAKAKYETYENKFMGIENIAQDENGFLLGLCTYCGKQFPLTNKQAKCRYKTIVGKGSGDGRFYCSEGCKISCPIFQQHKTYKDQKRGHLREVPAEFRKLILKERNYTCEKCRVVENGLHVHHIEGYTEMPMFATDKDNVMVLCLNCHKEVHNKAGCSYYDYRC